MPGVLEFDSDRELGFTPNRKLGFDPGRSLGFDPQRDRSFQAGRDLGFGKRGPVFRGYVCPVCGASVTEDQPTCTECGAVFERAPPSRLRPAASPPKQTTPPTAVPPPAPGAVSGARPSAAYPACVFCGARLSVNDGFCWNCGRRVDAGAGR